MAHLHCGSIEKEEELLEELIERYPNDKDYDDWVDRLSDIEMG